MTISLVDKVAGTTPAGGGGAVSSVNSRTGDVVLTAADVGATLLTGSNTGDETTTSIGTLIAGATAKTTPVAADIFGFADSQASNVLKECTLTNLANALYLLGQPQCIFTNAFPFFLLPGDGGTTGVTFTGGGGGAFTISAAPLSELLSKLSGRQCYGYLPANAGGSGNSAGWFLFIPSSDTAGTFYNNTYSSGKPAIVGSPTTFAGSPSGRITQTTGEITALSGFNMTPIGPSGELAFKYLVAGDSSATTKTYRFRVPGATVMSEANTTNSVGERLLTLRNCGTQTNQVISRPSNGVGTATSSISGNFANVDLSGPTTAITITMQISVNTGCACLLASNITQTYGG